VLTFFGAIALNTPSLYLSALPLAPKSSAISHTYCPLFVNTIRVNNGTPTRWPTCYLALPVPCGFVRSVAFSPDGRRLVSSSGDRKIHLWDADAGDPLVPPIDGHSGEILAVAFAPDGEMFASSSVDQTIQVWNAMTGKMVVKLEEHTGPIRSVVFLPDGHHLASVSDDRTVRLWNVDTAWNRTLGKHEDQVYSVACSPDGTLLASGSGDQTVVIWNTTSGDRMVTLRGHEDKVLSVAFSPDGSQIASGSEDCTVRIWDAETGQSITEPLRGHAGAVSSVAFALRGYFIASGSHDCMLRVWDPMSGHLIAGPFCHDHWVTSIAFSPDGGRIASGSLDTKIRIWNAEIEALRIEPSVHVDAITDVIFSSDGKLLASNSEDHTVRLWKRETGEPFMKPLLHTPEEVGSIAFTPDGTQIVSACYGGNIISWSTETGHEVPSSFCIDSEDEDMLGEDLRTLLSFSVHGDRLASMNILDGTYVWDFKTGDLIAGPLQFMDPVCSCACFSPDGMLAAAGSSSGRIQVWNVSSGRVISGPFQAHEDIVASVVFFPDSTRLASASKDSEIRLWDAKSGRLLDTLHEGSASPALECLIVNISPDGKRLASAHVGHNLIRVWNTETCNVIATLSGHCRSIQCLAFSPDSRQLASGSEDTAIRLWNLESTESTTPSDGAHDSTRKA
jgi:WD40 repeat protein